MGFFIEWNFNFYPKHFSGEVLSPQIEEPHKKMWCTSIVASTAGVHYGGPSCSLQRSTSRPCSVISNVLCNVLLMLMVVS